jgi:hypothetical protein
MKLQIELDDGRTWEHPAESEDEMAALATSYLEGNFSCDCNKELLHAEFNRLEIPEAPVCGETLKIKRLVCVDDSGNERGIE